MNTKHIEMASSPMKKKKLLATKDYSKSVIKVLKRGGDVSRAQSRWN